MRTICLKKITVCAIAFVLSACATDAGQKEQTGAILGAVIGGILGGAISGDRHRTTGVVAGALAGGLLGGQVGRYFDEQDRRRIAEASEKALREGARQSYVSPRTGARVVMTPGESTYEPGRAVPALATVYTAGNLRAESRQAYAATDLQVRASPSVTADVTGRFMRGEQLDVVASVPDSSYRLVARESIGIGYAIESDLVASLADLPPLLEPQLASAPSADIPVPKSPSKPPAKRASKPIAKTAKATAVKPDVSQTPPVTRVPETTTIAETKPSQFVSSPAVPQEVRSVTVAKECKAMTYDVALPNGQRSRGVQKYCNEPPAGWQPVTA